MQVTVSSDAAKFVIARGGQVWVWAARPRMCCGGAAALMRADTSQPAGVTGFSKVSAAAIPAEITVHFRGSGGTSPDVLEIAIGGKRHPKVAAYWDGCLMAMVT